MKKTILLATAFLVFGTGNSFAVDYSKCREFINPNSLGGNGGLGGGGFGFGFNMMPYLPFELQNDGKIKPHKDVVSYDYDKKKQQEIVVYEMPSFDSVEPEEIDSTNPYKQKMKKIKVIVQRDKDGNIVEIINDQNITKADIDHQVKFQKAYYDENTPEETKKQQKKWEEKSGEKFQLPFYSHAKTSVKFEIKNGQCVPVESKNTALIEAKVDGKTFKTTNFNINLCKDIDGFLKKNPEAASCFKKDLNKKISSIFDKYVDKNATYPMGGFGMGMGLGFPGGGFFGGPGAFGIGSLEQKLNFGKFWGDDESIKQKIRKGTGSSPVITGHMLLQQCYNLGLGSFIEDPEIWKKTGVQKASKDEGSSSTKDQ